MKVVGTIFLKDNKLLLVKPIRRPTYQMVGGKVEEGETIEEAAIRECHEELGKNAIFDESKFTFLMDFDEYKFGNLQPRFDIFEVYFQYSISIIEDDFIKTYKINHIKNAFDLNSINLDFGF